MAGLWILLPIKPKERVKTKWKDHQTTEESSGIDVLTTD